MDNKEFLRMLKKLVEKCVDDAPHERIKAAHIYYESYALHITEKRIDIYH